MYILGTTCLHIPLVHPCLYYYLLSPQYTVLHILFYCTFYSLFDFFNLYLYIFSCVVLRILHCPLSGPDLIYISLRIIFCIIEYVTNKITLNLNLNIDRWRRLDLQKSFRVSTLHQLLMNTFIFIWITRLFNHVLLCIESLSNEYKFTNSCYFLFADIFQNSVLWTPFIKSPFYIALLTIKIVSKHLTVSICRIECQ